LPRAAPPPPAPAAVAEDTRERIRAIAVAIVRAEGIGALSMRRVAERVGVTAMAVHHHFDKSALVDAVVAVGFDRWEAYMARALAKRTPRGRLREAAVQYREFALAEPRLFELMYLVPRPNVARAPDSVARTDRPVFGAILVAVQALVDAGELPAGDPGEAMLALWSTVHGMLALHFSGRFGPDADAFRRIYDRVLDRTLPASPGR